MHREAVSARRDPGSGSARFSYVAGWSRPRKGLAARPVNDLTEQHISGVGVEPLFAGRKIPLFLPDRQSVGVTLRGPAFGLHAGQRPGRP